jgi:hypothetical protein
VAGDKDDGGQVSYVARFLTEGTVGPGLLLFLSLKKKRVCSRVNTSRDPTPNPPMPSLGEAEWGERACSAADGRELRQLSIRTRRVLDALTLDARPEQGSIPGHPATPGSSPPNQDSQPGSISASFHGANP